MLNKISYKQRRYTNKKDSNCENKKQTKIKKKHKGRETTPRKYRRRRHHHHHHHHHHG
jgi:hypothetical protein